MLKDLHSLVSKDKEPKELTPSKVSRRNTATATALDTYKRRFASISTLGRKLTVWRRQIPSYPEHRFLITIKRFDFQG